LIALIITVSYLIYVLIRWQTLIFLSLLRQTLITL
jgi:hypothetical protein